MRQVIQSFAVQFFGFCLWFLLSVASSWPPAIPTRTRKKEFLLPRFISHRPCSSALITMAWMERITLSFPVGQNSGTCCTKPIHWHGQARGEYDLLKDKFRRVSNPGSTYLHIQGSTLAAQSSGNARCQT